MSTEIELTGQELMRKALDDLIADPLAKINMNTVANKAGLNHSLFSKSTYSKIRDEVIAEQVIRAKELHNKSLEQEIIALKSKLETANIKIVQQTEQLAAPKPKNIKATEGAMMTRLVEMYRFNDLLRSELREKHNEHINKETGEILKFESAKQR